MNKYTWSGGIDDNVLLEVVACRGTMTSEQPNDLIIDREDNNGGSFIHMDATERFMVLLRINGVNIARLPAHEVVKRGWDR